MNLFNLIRQYIDHVGGQFTDYDHTKAVVVVPLSGGRFQTIMVITKPSQISGKDLAVFTSKVCEYNGSIDAKELLQENSACDYCKFMIEEGYLKIEASCLATAINEDQVKEMLEEVAALADKFEMSITGRDVH